MNSELIDRASRHAVFVQRHAGHLANLFDPFLASMQKEIRLLLLADDVRSQRRINRIISDVRKIVSELFGEFNTGLFDGMDAFAISEADFQLESLRRVVTSGSITLSLPSDNVILTAIRNNPIIFNSTGGFALLEPFIRDIEARETKRIADNIRVGFASGRTTNQIASDIVGRGNVIDKTVRRNIKTMVRTGTNHLSSVARMTTMRENDDIVIGYQWLATLDNRTCPICRPLDMKVFLWKDKFKPLPPLHPNDRCTTVPVLDERFAISDDGGTRASKGASGGKPVSSSETYYSWLKKQPKAFVDDTIGISRSKLLRNGGLSIDEFRNLTTDQLFSPITLAEMKNNAPLVFETANI